MQNRGDERDRWTARFQKQNQNAYLLLAAELKRARQDAKLSQEKLAFLMGVNQALISRVERTGALDHVLLERFAAACNVPISRFITIDSAAKARLVVNSGSYAYYDRTREWWEVVMKEGRVASDAELATIRRGERTEVKRAKQEFLDSKKKLAKALKALEKRESLGKKRKNTRVKTNGSATSA
jgi:transcriptional regulator with XRE-family HTH domain